MVFDSSNSSLQGLGVLIGSVNFASMGCTDSSAFNYNSSVNTVTINDITLCITPISYGCTDTSTYTPDGINFYFTYLQLGSFNTPCDDSNGPACVDNKTGPNCCCIDTIVGCMDSTAINYDSLANTDNGSCDLGVPGCMDTQADNYNSAATVPGPCDYTPGCTDPTAFDYNTNASADCSGVPNGTDYDCCTAVIYGCMDSTFCSYNSNANTPNNNYCHNNMCTGCTDSMAINYDSTAVVEENPSTCCYHLGCTNTNASNYDSLACEANISCLFDGCTDPTALNFDGSANNDDGSCEYPVQGCTDPTAFNYDPLATQDDNTCVPFQYGCTDSTACNYNSAANVNDGSCLITLGCTDSNANNYDSNAQCDDGSCDYCIYGCTDSTALNYNSDATCDDGLCIAAIGGCIDSDANNYDSTANVEDGSCTYDVLGCMDSDADNYDSSATVDDGGCFTAVFGCTDPNSLCNYDAAANTDDGSCGYSFGCTDSNADNYDSSFPLCHDQGQCQYEGCTDPTATNYDSTANVDDGSCIPNEAFDATVGACDQNWCPATFQWPTSWNSDQGGNKAKLRYRIKDSNNPWAIHRNKQTPYLASDWAGGVPGNTMLFAVNSDYEWQAVEEGSGWNTSGEPTYGTHYFSTPPGAVFGCTTPGSINYNPNATMDDGSCIPNMVGCMDTTADNYNSSANTPCNGCCIHTIPGCTDPSANNYDSTADTDDGSCEYPVSGCMNPASPNYDSNATIDDGSCTFPIVFGALHNPGLLYNDLILVISAQQWNAFANYIQISNPSIGFENISTGDGSVDGLPISVDVTDDASITGGGVFNVIDQNISGSTDQHPNPSIYKAYTSYHAFATAPWDNQGNSLNELHFGTNTPVDDTVFVLVSDPNNANLIVAWPPVNALIWSIHADSVL